MDFHALNERLAVRLGKRKQEGTIRRLLVPDQQLVDFSSNDYLGLARNRELADLIKEAYEKLPLANGAGGSRLLSGNTAYTEELEVQMADFFQAPSTLLFNSGYVANQALLSSLPQKGDTIIYDELSHACIKEGARLSLAKRFSFRHNEVSHLEQRLTRAENQIFVVVESVYSMDGDVAPLKEISELCEQYGAALIVDEAHSTGIYGGGSGLVCELGLEAKVFARVHTFGKGMGSHGACVAGSHDLREFLINFARPFIYTTALPQHSVVSLMVTFNYLKAHPELLILLQEKINLFNQLKKEYLQDKLFPEVQIYSNSPIQAIICPGIESVRRLSQEMEREGIHLRPIIAPTVPEGKERLRVCLHTFNTNEEIENMVKTLAPLLR